MKKLNMAKINTLFKKGYLLAGVIMAANMFVMNEMRAMDDKTEKEQKTVESNQQKQKAKLNNPNGKEEIKNPKNIKTGQKNKKKSGKQDLLSFLLYWENTINLIGGLALSGANNYFKWWDYNAGGYLNLRIGCIGWRSKRLLDIFQFDINFNLGRGICWSIPHIINLIMIKGSKKGKKTGNFPWVDFLFKGILRGFTSMPLTVHFSNFSISISLDSIIWGIVGHILDKKDGKGGKEMKITDLNNIINLDKHFEEPLELDNINNKKNLNDSLYQSQPNEENQKGKESQKKNESKKPDLIIEGEKDNENEMNQNKKDPTKDETKEEEKKEETEKNPKNVPENLE